MVCDKCGKEMKKSDIFCLKCGAEVNSDALDLGKDDLKKVGFSAKVTLNTKITAIAFILGIVGLSMDWVSFLGFGQSGFQLGGAILIVPFGILLIIAGLKIIANKIVAVILDIIGILVSGFISVFMIGLFMEVSGDALQREALGVGFYIVLLVTITFVFNSFNGVYRSLKGKKVNK